MSSGCRGVGGALEECREALAAIDVAALRMVPELARSHVIDHALTQRTDSGIGTHGELLLSEVADTSIIPQNGAPHPAIVSSQLATQPSIGHPAQRLSRQRFSALAPSTIVDIEPRHGSNLRYCGQDLTSQKLGANGSGIPM